MGNEHNPSNPHHSFGFPWKTFIPERLLVNTDTDPVTKVKGYRWSITDGCPERYRGVVAYAANASVPAPLPQFDECIFADVGARQTTGWIDVGEYTNPRHDAITWDADRERLLVSSGRMMDTLDHSNWK